MTIQDLKTTITNLNEQDFFDLFGWVCGDEYDRRKAAPAVEKAQADLVIEFQEAGRLPKPATATEEQAKENADSVPEWESPLTDHSKMYALDAVVAHNGRFWKSTHPGLNSWEPGAHGVDEYIWRDITERVRPTAPEENTASPGPIPFAPELPVKEGDLIEYEGVVYKVLSPHTTQSYWPPNESPSLFQRV